MRYNNEWKQGSTNKLQDSIGATAVIVAISIIVLIGAVALAVDIAHLTVVKGELQNAADAGALEGARVLYNYDGTGTESVNTGANLAALQAALKNYSDKEAVEVDLNSDVQRGTWDTESHSFTPSSSMDTSIINSVRVTTHRSAAQSIFAQIFGIQSFTSSATAVAYRGYAGNSVEYDEPLAICRNMIEDENGNYQCTTGLMVPSPVETARWTNFSEDCDVNASQSNVTPMICTDTDPVDMSAISTINGEVQPTMNAMKQCWENATNRTQFWGLTLPVVECVTPVTCSQIIGAVSVNVVWVTENGNDPQYNEIPQQMEDWSSADCADVSTAAGREQCWVNFADHFNLSFYDANGVLQPAPYQQNTLYFLPDCEFTGEGGPGGSDFNVHAQYPKLVQ